MINSRRRRGFTLVEVLVVIVIVGVLMALLLPAVQMARASARAATCANNEKQIGVAFRRYLQQHGRAPKAELLAQGLAGYYAEDQASIYKCPDVTDGTSYGANKFVHQMLDDSFKVILLDAKESPIPFDDETSEEWREKVDPRHSGTFNVLYFDGHVEKQVAFGIDPYVEDAKNKWMWEPNRYSEEEDCDCPEVPAVAGGLVAHYTFDEPTAMGLDSSGTGHSAIYHPLKVESVEDPERCLVARFKSDSELGTTYPVFRISSAVTSGCAEWTVCYWHKCDSNSGHSAMFHGNRANGSWTLADRFHLFEHGSPGCMHIQSGVSAACPMAEVPSRNAWHHFGAALSVTNGQLYTWVDGKPFVQGDARHSIRTIVTSVIAAMENTPDNPIAGTGVNGHFDDIRVYERLLSNTDVLTLYEQGKSKEGCGE